MANDENKFLPIFQILDIKNVSFLLKLEMALAISIRMKFEQVWYLIWLNSVSSNSDRILKRKRKKKHLNILEQTWHILDWRLEQLPATT